MEQANRSRVSIRRAVPADAPGIARVRVITWKAQYTGIVPAGYLAQLSPEEDVPRWRQALAHPAPGRFILVAEDQAQIVGFAAAGPERTGDEVYWGRSTRSMCCLSINDRASAGS